MKKWTLRLVAVLLAGVVLFSSCKKDDPDTGVDPTEGFDRAAMLQQYAEGYIIPAYTRMTADLAALRAETDNFAAAPTGDRLDALREAWRTAYVTWQRTAMLEFGPAEDISLRMYINTYPATVSKINNNISTGDYDLEQFGHKDAQGFPALDYLLNGMGSREDILAAYTSDALAPARIQYLKDLTTKMHDKVAQVNEEWNTYRSSFVARTGTDAGSSLSKMVNSYVLYYERFLRSGKIGLPAGAMTGVAAPQLTEAYYSPELSNELAAMALNSVRDFYEGKSYDNGTDGRGFKDYLAAVGTTDDDGTLIADVISEELDEAVASLAGLNEPVKNAVTSNRTQVLTIYQELQELVPLFKVDMVSAFGISITYSDNDGD